MQTGYAGKVASLWGGLERPGCYPARRLRSRRCILDRAEERRVDYFHLLSPRPAQVGAGFQLRQSRGKVLGQGLEKQQRRRDALNRASQGERGQRRRFLRGDRLHALRQRIRAGIRQGTDRLRESWRRTSYRFASYQPLSE